MKFVGDGVDASGMVDRHVDGLELFYYIQYNAFYHRQATVTPNL
jgi:hypothetical protein